MNLNVLCCETEQILVIYNYLVGVISLASFFTEKPVALSVIGAEESVSPGRLVPVFSPSGSASRLLCPSLSADRHITVAFCHRTLNLPSYHTLIPDQYFYSGDFFVLNEYQCAAYFQLLVLI